MEDSCALNEDYRNDTLPNSVVLEDTVQPGLLQVNTVWLLSDEARKTLYIFYHFPFLLSLPKTWAEKKKKKKNKEIQVRRAQYFGLAVRVNFYSWKETLQVILYVRLELPTDQLTPYFWD